MDISNVMNPVTQNKLEPVVKPESQVDPKLVDATRQFESVFIQQFLGQALKPMLHATPESKGPGSGIYHYMMTEVIANALAEQEKFGVSSALQAQLAGRESGKSPMREDISKTVITGNKS